MSEANRYLGIRSKAGYVAKKLRGPSHGHHCHWPGCDRKVPPAAWGCRKHWYMLPEALRIRIWRTFKPGQEVSKTPSREYVEAAQAVQAWIAEHQSAAEAGDAAVKPMAVNPADEPQADGEPVLEMEPPF